jgi:3-ketosteroid 9alpha-monooxygenase subunit B
MAVSPGTPAAQSSTVQPRLARDHGFHPLPVREIVRETDESCSLVLEIPDELTEAFAYRAGQFVTFRLSVDGQQHLRSYSMSSSPDVDGDFRVTVKRVPGGSVSNWLIDTVKPGDVLDTTCPAGVFCLGSVDRDVVAFGAGSGITPIFAITKTALATTSRRVHVLYANRDQDSIIFAAELEQLARRHPDRLEVVHHLDTDSGFIDAAAVTTHIADCPDANFFICGPGPFMTIVEDTLFAQGVEADRIHIERFTPREEVAAPPAAAAVGDDSVATEVTIELDGRVETTRHQAGTTILQTARQAGLQAPSSCENGDCATCMAKLKEGTATMRNNNALTEDEVEEGWILTCQAVPAGPSVHVIYGYDD